MAEYTKYQRMRLDCGLAADDTVSLPDEQIDDAYARVSPYYSDPVALNAAAHVVVLEQLYAQAVISTDYTQNDTVEKGSQLFSNYGKLLESWKRTLDDVLNQTASVGAGTVRSGKTRKMPSRIEEYPDPSGGWR